MKAKKIISIVLMVLPALLMAFSAILKFAGAAQVVEGLTKVGFLPHFPLPALALLETACVMLLLIPKTWRIGFFLVCGYLGGATAVEIISSQPPTAPILLTLIWVGAYLRDKSLFTGAATK
jgi:hypothetical protein